MLRHHQPDGDAACAECERNPPVGPCAACEAMICGDCGVLTKDPGGVRCICLSCARLVAAVDRPKLQRRPLSRVVVAIFLLAAFAAAAFSLLRP